jgi:hypothetical protein
LLLVLLLLQQILLQLKHQDKEATDKEFELHLLVLVDQKEAKDNKNLTVHLHLLHLFILSSRVASLTLMMTTLNQCRLPLSEEKYYKRQQQQQLSPLV